MNLLSRNDNCNSGKIYKKKSNNINKSLHSLINKNKEDTIKLSSILDKKVIQISNLFSYIIATFMTLLILCLNGLFEICLDLIAIIFSFVKEKMQPYLNEIRRETSNFEEYSFDNIESNPKLFLYYFSKAQNLGNKFQKISLFPFIIEISLIASLVIITMTQLDSNYINFFLFYLFLPITLNENISKLISTCNLSDEIYKEINLLKFDLNTFKYQYDNKFYYNIRDRKYKESVNE